MSMLQNRDDGEDFDEVQAVEQFQDDNFNEDSFASAHDELGSIHENS